ncbi:hypothetical protein BHE74_00055904 [Ensete ventricosum]|nr:hypothetical protein BHE74_00055904 [Ensete ventricosum]RZS24523.1 hypothetical protein BHM03_00057600 [Ensete ventricosum]
MRTGGAADGCQWQGVAQLGYEQSGRARRPCHGRPCLPRFRYYLDNCELPCHLLQHDFLIQEATLLSDLKNTTTLSLIRKLDGYLAAYDGFCELKQVALVGRVSRGNSIRKVMVKEAKLCDAMKVVVGVNQHCALGSKPGLALARERSTKAPGSIEGRRSKPGLALARERSTKAPAGSIEGRRSKPGLALARERSTKAPGSNEGRRFKEDVGRSMGHEPSE